MELVVFRLTVTIKILLLRSRSSDPLINPRAATKPSFRTISLLLNADRTSKMVLAVALSR
jgi:hypothetical protein